MRLLRAFVIALLTAIVGGVLAFFVGDYLTRLAHVPEMEGQRGMTVIFLCVPPGILAWSEWIFATQRADLSPVPEPERFAARYRVRTAD